MKNAANDGCIKTAIAKLEARTWYLTKGNDDGLFVEWQEIALFVFDGKT